MLGHAVVRGVDLPVQLGVLPFSTVRSLAVLARVAAWRCGANSEGEVASFWSITGGHGAEDSASASAAGLASCREGSSTADEGAEPPCESGKGATSSSFF